MTPKELITKIKKEFPNPTSSMINGKAKDFKLDNTYCILGAAQLYLGFVTYGFPTSWNIKMSLKIKETGIGFVNDAIAFNDSEQFEKAWKALEAALAYSTLDFDKIINKKGK